MHFCAAYSRLVRESEHDRSGKLQLAPAGSKGQSGKQRLSVAEAMNSTTQMRQVEEIHQTHFKETKGLFSG